MLRELKCLAPENVGFLPNKVVTSPDYFVARKTHDGIQAEARLRLRELCLWGQQQNEKWFQVTR
jgi:hypothetical protein